jgi:hypothetical protein
MKILVYGNAPVAKPNDENEYTWNESTLTWDIVEKI